MIKTWEQLAEIQPVVAKMLVNSVMKQRVAHAYLFDGPKGTRKEETAFFFAKVLLCQHLKENNPCQQCSNCRRIDSHNHPDVYFIEPDGLSIKKEQIQGLQSEFSKTAVESDKKIYILKHSDKMTPNAANSLLKFLEEPLGNTYAFLLSENSHRMLNTILSRCQSVAFRMLPTAILHEDLIQAGISSTNASLFVQLTSSMEEAFVYNNDEWFAQARELVIKLNEAYYQGSNQEMYLSTEKWTKHFTDKEKIHLGLDMLILFFKDVLYAQTSEQNKSSFPDKEELIQQLADRYSSKQIIERFSILLEAKRRITGNGNIGLIIEQFMIQLQEG